MRSADRYVAPATRSSEQLLDFGHAPPFRTSAAGAKPFAGRCNRSPTHPGTLPSHFPEGPRPPPEDLLSATESMQILLPARSTPLRAGRLLTQTARPTTPNVKVNARRRRIRRRVAGPGDRTPGDVSDLRAICEQQREGDHGQDEQRAAPPGQPDPGVGVDDLGS